VGGAAVADLQATRGRSVVIAGESAAPAVHALAHAMNAALGNVGATVTYTPTTEVQPSNQLADLKTLVADMDGGRVDFV
jgi:molybdopterin-containing oxidoreductase family iron-sulfur binding subunit